MCGIVGLLIKNPALRGSLGAWMVPMLVGMGERGPDSAGLAVFTDSQLGDSQLGDSRLGELRKYSLYAPEPCDWSQLSAMFQQTFGEAPQLDVQANHAVLCTGMPIDSIKQWLKQSYPALHLLSVGRAIDLYKDTGSPAEVCQRYNFQTLRGTHLVGHTRMATESAVTPAHAHPFTAGEDFCLVHNGSLSNHHQIRRQLEPLGIQFETDNDTEAACRFLEWRMREGDDLETALQKGFVELDGFYTFLMGTANKLALVRDAFACKPAVIAETDDYVAIASEFRSLSHLPDIHQASIYEPAPEEMYVWTV